MRRRPVPVHLEVVVVAVRLGVARKVQIVLEPVVRAGVVRLGVQRLDLPRDAADAVRRDDRVLEEAAIRAGGRAGRGIVNAEARVEREHLAEVAIAHLRGRHRVGVEDALTFGVSLPRSEVEQFVPPNRSAGSASENRCARIDFARIEVPAACIQLILLTEEEGRALERIRPRLRLDRSCCATRHALGRIETVRRDVDVLNRLRRRNVACVMRQPHVDACGAVDSRDVVVAIGAIDVDRQRAGGRVRLRVLKFRRRGARNQVHQVLIVPVLIQWQVDDILRTQVNAHVSLVGLQEGRLRRHGNRLRQCANLETAIDADDTAGGDRNAGLDEFLEARQHGFQRVGAAGNVANRVGAFTVGHARQLQAGVLVLDRDGHTGDIRTLGIGDVPDESAVEILCKRGRCRDSGDQNGRENCQ